MMKPTKPTKYTKEQKEWFKKYVPGHSHREIMEEFNRRFAPAEITLKRVAAYIKNNGLNTGRTGQFQKGHVPYNKGLKGIRLSPASEFKKGNRPHNALPVGSVVMTTGGYLQTKIAEPNKWKRNHILLWESEFGPVPKGSCIILKDQDRTNITLENLALVTRRELLEMNGQGYIYEDAELTEIGHMIAKLNIKANSRAKTSKKRKRPE